MTQKNKIDGLFAGQSLWMLSNTGLDRLRAARLKAGPSPDWKPTGSSAHAIQRVGPTAVVSLVGLMTKYPIDQEYGFYDDWYGLCPATRIMEHLQALRSDASIYNIILRIDSPGGSVAGSTELAELVAAINKEKPIDAVVSDDCCSAAYYIASQCRTITANNSAWVGSIGVLIRLTDDYEFWAKMGIVDHVVDSGGVKGLGHDGKVPKELEAEMQRLVDGQAELFINTVSQGRNMPVERVRQLAIGRVWLADEAMNLGLIDAVESVDSAIGRITTEILTMKREEFTAAAKANPDWVAEYIEQGRLAAAEAAKPKIATAGELKAAFPDEADRGFVFDRLGTDASLVEHQLAHREALIKQRSEAVTKIEQLKNEAAANNPGSAGLPAPVGVTKPNAANPNPLVADAKRRAEAAAKRN